MLRNKKTGNNDKTTGKQQRWIIDTGASNHMNGDLSCMESTREIQGCPVGMPDGGQAQATKERVVTLHDDLVLKKGLHFEDGNWFG